MQKNVLPDFLPEDHLPHHQQRVLPGLLRAGYAITQPKDQTSTQIGKGQLGLERARCPEQIWLSGDWNIHHCYRIPGEIGDSGTPEEITERLREHASIVLAPEIVLKTLSEATREMEGASTHIDGDVLDAWIHVMMPGDATQKEVIRVIRLFSRIHTRVLELLKDGTISDTVDKLAHEVAKFSARTHQ